MVVKIDMSHPPSNIRKIIINEIEINKSKLAGNSSDVDYGIENSTGSGQSDVNNVVDITLHKENNAHIIKQRLKDVLMKSRIRDYVAVTDPEEKNKIVIVKKEHAETLGVYHCLHCGMSFENQIQLSTHQRIHYFFKNTLITHYHFYHSVSDLLFLYVVL